MLFARFSKVAVRLGLSQMFCMMAGAKPFTVSPAPGFPSGPAAIPEMFLISAQGIGEPSSLQGYDSVQSIEPIPEHTFVKQRESVRAECVNARLRHVHVLDVVGSLCSGRYPDRELVSVEICLV